MIIKKPQRNLNVGKVEQQYSIQCPPQCCILCNRSAVVESALPISQSAGTKDEPSPHVLLVARVGWGGGVSQVCGHGHEDIGHEGVGDKATVPGLCPPDIREVTHCGIGSPISSQLGRIEGDVRGYWGWGQVLSPTFYLSLAMYCMLASTHSPPTLHTVVTYPHTHHLHYTQWSHIHTLTTYTTHSGHISTHSPTLTHSGYISTHSPTLLTVVTYPHTHLH